MSDLRTGLLWSAWGLGLVAIALILNAVWPEPPGGVAWGAVLGWSALVLLRAVPHE